MPPRADHLADKQHRRFVALALADHNRSGDGQEVEGAAHGFHRRVVGPVLVAASDKVCDGDRSRLRDAHRFKRERAVQRQIGHLNLLSGRLFASIGIMHGGAITLSDAAMILSALSTAAWVVSCVIMTIDTASPGARPRWIMLSIDTRHFAR